MSKYNRALGQTLLASIDNKQPIMLSEFEALHQEMKLFGYSGEAKLESDWRMVVSAGNGREWIDQFGDSHPPLTRQDVLAGLSDIQITPENQSRIAQVFREATPAD